MVYEYFCENGDSIFELIRPVSECDQTGTCPKCGRECERIPSLPFMKPDNLWHGQMIPGYGYFTSRHGYQKALKARGHVELGDRTEREGFEKLADDAAKSRQAAFEKASEKYFTDTLGPSGMGVLGSD